MKIQIEITKLYQILHERGLTQKDLYALIVKTNNGKPVAMYILNEIINGKRKNFNTNTASAIITALNVTYNDILE